MGKAYWHGYVLAMSATMALYAMALLTGQTWAGTLATLATDTLRQALSWVGAL